jgi:hypothetical protein
MRLHIEELEVHKLLFALINQVSLGEHVVATSLLQKAVAARDAEAERMAERLQESADQQRVM